MKRIVGIWPIEVIGGSVIVLDFLVLIGTSQEVERLGVPDFFFSI